VQKATNNFIAEGFGRRQKQKNLSGLIIKPNQVLDPKQDELNVRFFEKS